MKNLTIATTAAAILTAGFFGLAAPALAAPTGNGDAQATISSLEAQGNRVIVNRLSDAPLSQSDVVSVNKGGDIRGTVMDDFSDRTYQQAVTGHVYYVDVR
jgi:hypothetical protein